MTKIVSDIDGCGLETFYVKEVTDNNNADGNEIDKVDNFKKITDHQWKYNYGMILLLIWSHIFSIYGFYLGFTKAKIATLIWYFVLIQFGAMGIIMGEHIQYFKITFVDLTITSQEHIVYGHIDLTKLIGCCESFS